MTEPTFTLRITKNGTKLATEDFAAKITASQRSEVQAWLEGGSSPAQPDTQRLDFIESHPKWDMHRRASGWLLFGRHEHVRKPDPFFGQAATLRAAIDAAMAAAAPNKESNQPAKPYSAEDRFFDDEYS